MASGRKDYWYAMLPGLSALGINQSAWFAYGFDTVGTLAVEDLIDYTVPEDYILNISGGVISAGNPGKQLFNVLIDSVNILGIDYDSIHVMPFGGFMAYIVTEGQNIILRVNNLDDIDCVIRASLIGFEEYKVTG